MVPVLRLPGNLDYIGTKAALPLLERGSKRWAMPIRPGDLVEDASDVRIAGLRDGALPARAPGRILARGRADICHQLLGALEARAPAPTKVAHTAAMFQPR